MNKEMMASEYLSAMSKGQEKFYKALSPLIKELCESYDIDREIKINTLNEIVSEGQERISNAVEKVIAKHDKELQEIAMRAKAERESALASIGRTGSCSGYNHSMRMAALRGSHDRYLDQLLMAQNRSLGVGYGHGLLGGWS